MTYWRRPTTRLFWVIFLFAATLQLFNDRAWGVPVFYALIIVLDAYVFRLRLRLALQRAKQNEVYMRTF